MVACNKCGSRIRFEENEIGVPLAPKDPDGLVHNCPNKRRRKTSQGPYAKVRRWLLEIHQRADDGTYDGTDLRKLGIHPASSRNELLRAVGERLEQLQAR